LDALFAFHANQELKENKKYTKTAVILRFSRRSFDCAAFGGFAQDDSRCVFLLFQRIQTLIGIFSIS